jgi:hypothetical protein
MSGAHWAHLSAKARQWSACAFRRFASLLSARDLVRKPDTTFRDHALLPEANLFFRVVVGTARTHRRRENGMACVIASQRVRPEVAGAMVNSAKQSRRLVWESGLLFVAFAPRKDEVRE